MTLHEVRFKGREQHGIRAFCTCGWHIDVTSGQTLVELAALIKRHKHGKDGRQPSAPDGDRS